MFMPFGPWRPDVTGLNAKTVRDVRNVLPAANGFKPFRSHAATMPALAARCLGAATARGREGLIVTAAGTATKLYRIQAGGAWADATRTTGGDYAVGSGDRWQFADFGDLLLAVNGTDAPQKLSLIAPASFSALGGNPPKARYITVIGDAAAGQLAVRVGVARAREARERVPEAAVSRPLARRRDAPSPRLPRSRPWPPRPPPPWRQIPRPPFARWRRPMPRRTAEARARARDRFPAP